MQYMSILTLESLWAGKRVNYLVKCSIDILWNLNYLFCICLYFFKSKIFKVNMKYYFLYKIHSSSGMCGLTCMCVLISKFIHCKKL